MNILNSCKPENVFGIFEEICSIPHGSYNLDEIRAYIIDFAERAGIEYTADAYGNIILRKPATEGYEDKPGIVLQAHMDMVAVCEDGSGIDMKTTPPEIFTEGDMIGARGTSLGGDDGIGVAMALAILDSVVISHPTLEVIITANEETGMEGAKGLDMSLIKGRQLINLDSEDEGIFTVGCAGGARVKCYIPADSEAAVTSSQDTFLEIRISGLKGGHSGTEIHLGRGNASKLMGRLTGSTSVHGRSAVIHDIKGGNADNAIPADCMVRLSLPSSDIEGFIGCIKKEAAVIKSELSKTDPGFTVNISVSGNTDPGLCMSLMNFTSFINSLPNGIIAMSGEVEGLVETSLNLGILKIEGDRLVAEFAVRSSVDSEKDALIKRLQSLTEGFGGTNTVTGVYPGWKYAPESPLRDRMVRVFRDMYGHDPKVEAIHAGLECGWFMSKAPDIDAVSIGPDMQSVHSTSERLSVSSTERVYEYLLKVLAD